MQNEAQTAANNHQDKSDGLPVEASSAPVGVAPGGLTPENTPAIDSDSAAKAAMTEDTDAFEIPTEPESGDGVELEMMPLDAAPTPADVAVGAEKPKKEKLDFRRRSLTKELEQKEHELARLHDDYAKLASIHAELKDRYLRLAAEMDNFRKRLERDFANRVESAVAGLLSELLPVVDDLERFFGARKGPEAGNETKDYEALAAGARLIYQNVLKILQSRGVTPMEAVGGEFNPIQHEAIVQMAVEGKAPNLVVQENTKGYLLHDKVLRPARVIVSG